MFQKLKTTKVPAGGFPNPKGESLVSLAPSDLSSLALSLTKEVSGEAESRDMKKVEGELDSSPPELLCESSDGGLGVSVLSGTATFCCGAPEAASKVRMGLLLNNETGNTSVKSQTAGGT